MAKQIKIFQGHGYEGIRTLQHEVNSWVADLDVISITPTMCTVGHPNDELYQCLVVAIVYEDGQ